MILRDVVHDLNLYGIDIDWKKKSLSEFLEFNGYRIISEDWGEGEYSDIKGYLDVEIELID